MGSGGTSLLWPLTEYMFSKQFLNTAVLFYIMATTQDQKKPSSLDNIIEIISKNISLFSKDAKNRTYDFIRIMAISYGYTLAGILALGIVTLLLGIIFAATTGTFNIYELIQDAFADQTKTFLFVGLFVLAALPILFISGWYAYSADLVAYSAGKAQNEGKQIAVLEESRKLRKKALPLFIIETILATGATLSMGAIFFLGLGGIFGSAALSGASSKSGLSFLGAILGFYAVVFAIMALFWVLSSIYFFFTQFWKINVVLGNMSWFDGFKSSLGMVRKKIWKVLLFDILLGILGFAITFGLGVGLYVILLPLQIIGTFVGFIVPFMYIAIMIVLTILRFLGYLGIGALVNALTVPSKVEFWKSLNEEPIEGNATKK